jgi:ELWxxDGT repeat protein
MSVRTLVLYALGYLVGFPALSAPLPIPQSLGDLKTSVTLANPFVSDVAVLGDRTLLVLRRNLGDELWVSEAPDEAPRLLGEFCPFPLHQRSNVSPSQVVATAASDRVYYVSRCRAFSELWVSDGTRAGTRLLFSGSNGLTVLGDLATPGHVLFFDRGAVWATDGTRSGTRSVLATTSFFPEAAAARSARLGNLRVFALRDTDRKLKLWVSDGTVAGTALASDLTPGVLDSEVVESFVTLGDRVILLVATGGGTLELWRTDGRSAGTERIAELGPFTSASSLRPRILGGSQRAYVIHPASSNPVQLWVTDGTSGGTRTLSDLVGLDQNGNAIVLGNRLYLADQSGEVWTSDGTPSGTRQLPDLRATGSSFQGTTFGALLPVRRAGLPDFQNEMWRFDSDGSSRALTPPREVYSLHEALAGSGFFFDFDPSSALPSRLWWTDGTATNTRVVASFAPGTTFQSRGLDATGAALFAVTAPGAPHPVLQRYENRPVAPGAWLDFAPLGEDTSSLPRFAVTRPDRLYFTANVAQGFSRWILDRGQTTLRAVPGGSTLDAVPTLDGLLSRSFNDGDELLLRWSDDGDIEPVATILGRAPFPPLSPVGPDHWFPATEGLFRYGAATRTVERLVELPDGYPDQSSPVVRLGDFSYFFHAMAPTGRFWRLLRTDGTPSGTATVIDIEQPFRLVTTGNQLFFTRDAGRELWVSDGTAAGTRALAPRFGFLALSSLVATPGRLFFAAFNPATGDEELWTSDGTDAGTRKLADHLGGVCCRQESPEIRALGNGVIFAAAPDNTGGELWFSDGTPSGTRRVADLWPGPGSSNPAELTALGGRVFFRASDPEHGAELWVTDGTFDGTSRLTDLYPGVRGSNPTAFAALGDRLFFGGDDGEIGAEPWLLPLDAVGERPIPPLPSATWLSSNAVPGFRFQVRFAGGILGRRETDCIGETLCVSGAVAGRPEVFLRVVGPRPNGFLWPTLVKFTTSEVEIWVEQEDTGQLRYYTLAAARPGIDELPARFDRLGFQPTARFTAAVARGESDPPPPAGSWFESTAVPGFRFKVRIANGSPNEPTVRQESDCIAETVCVSGAIPGRSEVFARVVGPRPNGFLWPIVARFTGSRVEVWIEQKATGEVQYYELPAVSSASDALTGLFDREGFAP